MRLESDDAVHDVDAGLFEGASPRDVRRFVESRFELDERDDLLARLRCADEVADDRALRPRRPVQRPLDREDVRIGGRLLDEGLDRRRERVVRVMHEDVARGGSRRRSIRSPLLSRGRVTSVDPRLVRLEDRRESRLRRRRPRLFLQLRTVERVHLPEPAEVERCRDGCRRPAARARARRSAARGRSRTCRRSTSSRTTCGDRRRYRRPSSIASSRSSASSSSTSRSALRVTRNGYVDDDLHAREEHVEASRDQILEWQEALAVLERDEPRAANGGTLTRAKRGSRTLRVGHRRRRGSATGSRCTGTGARGRRRAA